ncbi:MAG: VWA domain-containing protein [Planctomycetes bacterium]|nr:VWA domain-containing protein [Planctomycetota bacterium]
MMIFQDPWVLLSAILILLWALARRFWMRPAAIDFSSLALMSAWVGKGRSRPDWIPPWMEAVSLLLVVVALARPQEVERGATVIREGTEIVLCLDISSSMARQGLAGDRSDLEVAKTVIRSFVAARTGDALGLITFAGYPRLACPLTLDHEALSFFIEKQECMVQGSPLDGTGIGAALGEAARRFEERADRTAALGNPVKDRVVILLTDGEENQHRIEPLDAARLCAQLKIRVYTVFAGGAGAAASSFAAPRDQDHRLLKEVARITGGMHVAATRANDLETVFDAINALEKKPLIRENFVRRRDLYRSVLVPASILFLSAFILAKTLFLRVP